MDVTQLLGGLSFSLLASMAATFWKVNQLTEKVASMEQHIDDILTFLVNDRGRK